MRNTLVPPIPHTLIPLVLRFKFNADNQTIRTSLSHHCAASMEEIAEPLISDRNFDPPPFKKRKAYRRRPQSEDEEDDGIHTSPPIAPTPDSVSSKDFISQSSREADAKALLERETPLSVAEILRQRKSIQRRRGGIEYRTVDTASKSEASGTQAISSLLDKDDTLDKITTVVDRFAPQTGQVADVDQHMYAMPHSALLGYLMHILK